MVREIVLALLVVCTACQAHRADGPHAPVEYYAGFRGYNLPLRLVEQLTEEQARSRGWAYYLAHYEGGQLVVVEKRFPGGKMEFRHEYTYDTSGRLTNVRITGGDDRVRLLVRGGDGKLHEPVSP